MSNVKRINDEKYISNLFRNLAKKKEVPITVCCRGQHIKASMLFSARHGYEPTIRLLENTDLSVRDKIEVTFYNNEAIFLFQTRITSLLDNNCSVENPQIVFSSFRRLMTRYKVQLDEEALIIPDGSFMGYRIVDVSSKGLAFEAQYESFHIGQILRKNIIKLGDSLEAILDGEIRHCIKRSDGICIYGLSFHRVEWVSYYQYFKYIMEKVYPKLKHIVDIPEAEITSLIEKRIVNNTKDSNGMGTITEDKVRFIQSILKNPLIYSCYVYYKNQKPLASGSVLRIYERTFLGQQILAIPEAKVNPRTGTEVYLGLADYMLNNPCFLYYLKYITNDLAWHQELFQNIDSIIKSRDKFIFDKLQLFECNLKEVESHHRIEYYGVESLEKPDEFISYCQESLNPLVSNSYSYNKEHFYLSEIGQVYETIGSSVKRKLWRVSNGNMTVAYAIAEAFSEGTDIFNVDICRVYFTLEGIEIKFILKTLLPKVKSFYKKLKKEKVSLLFKAWERVAKDINLPGLEYKSEIGRVVMNYEGLAEYKKLLGENFVNYVKYYPLTHPQLAIWYTEKVYPNTSFGCLAQIVRFMEAVNYELLEQAINLVIEKNEGLRLRMAEIDGNARQYVSKYKYSKIHLYDFSRVGSEYGIETWDENKTSAPFNLIDTDLFYFALIKLSDNEGGFYIKVHHLISDAWTMTLLLNRIIEYYSKLKREEKISKKNAPSYLDYVLSEEEYKNSNRFLMQKEFWSKKFETVPEFVSLKPSNTSLKSIEAKRKTFNLSKKLTAKIHKYCESVKVTPSTFFLSILSIYINRVTTKEDIVIGIPVLNRSNQKEKDTSGMFISMIPVRLKVEPSKDFVSFTESVTKEWKQLLKNQKYPFDLIQKDFRERHKSTENLFDISLSYQNVRHEKSELTGDYEVSWHFNGNQTESLIIHISDWDDDGLYTVHMDYLTEVFGPDEIENMIEHVKNLIGDAANNHTKKIQQLEILSENEKNKLLYEFNDTYAEYPKHKTIHQMFEEQTERRPDNVAVFFRDTQLTYNELNKKSNQLARKLRDKGIERNDIVGIMLKRSLEMIIGVMGILKAGGAYMPIDPYYPVDRIKYMLEDSNSKILLTKTEFVDKIEFNGSTLNLDNYGFYSGQDDNIEAINDSNDLAYIIYTSGSTGRPKGVMIEHYSVINRLNWMQKLYPIRDEDVILQKTPYTFDVSVWELFWWSFQGSQVCMLEPGGEREPEMIVKGIEENKVTTMHFVPSMLNAFLEYIDGNIDIERLSSLKQVFASGEALNVQQVNRFNKLLYKNFGTKLHNLYGPTEATVDVSYFDCSTGKEHNVIPIGKPIDNIKLYILDKCNRIQPIGMPGELLIGGDGLARGYLNRQELTAEKFIESPFAKGEKLYKTGDLVKWMSDGNIEYLGRIDHQVKIRGNRIELGEIEACLISHNAVKEAVILAREDSNGGKYLCAYAVSDEKLDWTEIRDYLLKELPEYMVPSYFVQLEEMPLSSNGKVDRKALPEPGIDEDLGQEYIAPRNFEEEKLSEVWSEVLEIGRVGIKDNFFELGGDSIRAIQVAAGLQKYGITLSIQDVFKNPTIEELSKQVRKFNKKTNNSLVVGEVELTPVQKWFFESKLTDMHHFNQAVMLNKKDRFDEKTVLEVFKEITKNHDALRMIFKFEAERVVQLTRGIEGECFKLETIDLKGHSDFKQIILNESERLQAGIDLKNGPVIRLGLFKTNEGDQLLIVIHHLMVDGVSWRIILDDFNTGYNQYEKGEKIKLQDKSDSFKHWAECLYEYSGSKELLRQIGRWKALDDLSIRPLPKDYFPEDNKVEFGCDIKLSFEKDTTERLLKQVNNRYHTEINDILLTALGLAVKNWTGEDKILVTIEGHGREEFDKSIDVSRTVGWFTSIFPVLINVEKSNDFGYTIKSVKEGLRQIPDKGFGYGVLKYITSNEAKRSTEFLAKPEICFNYLGQFDSDFNTDVFSASQLPTGHMVSKNSDRSYTFDINGMIQNGEMTFVFNYNSKEYRAETVKKFVEAFENEIYRLIDHCLEDSKTQLTPSDFGDKDLSLEELDEISNMLEFI